jgi:hypothetical protein
VTKPGWSKFWRTVSIRTVPSSPVSVSASARFLRGEPCCGPAPDSGHPGQDGVKRVGLHEGCSVGPDHDHGLFSHGGWIDLNAWGRVRAAWAIIAASLASVLASPGAGQRSAASQAPADKPPEPPQPARPRQEARQIVYESIGQGVQIPPGAQK